MNLIPNEAARYTDIDAKLESPSLWFNTISNLQKGIRRGDVDHALLSATLLYHTDPIKLLRRLCVIALEDVGFGNIKLVAKTLDYAASHKSVLHLTTNAQTLVETLSLVSELAHSVKDRSPCQLSVTAKRYMKGVNRVASLSPEKCAAIYADDSEHMYMRCLAARSLTGNFTIDNQRVGKTDRKALVSALSTMELPARIFTLTQQGISFGGEPAGLAANIPILYGLMKAESRTTCTRALPPTVLIRGLLSAAYDVHTLEGKWALSAFAVNCEPLRQFSAMVGVEAKKIVGMLVFTGEGSVVNRDVRCTLTNELYASNEQSQCVGVSFPYDALPEAKQILLDNLALLNHHRRRIAEAASYFDVQKVDDRQGTLL